MILRKNILIIGFFILIISCIIYLVKNNQYCFNKFKRISENVKTKIIFIIFVFILSFISINKCYRNIKGNINTYSFSNSNKAFFEECDNLVLNETKYYNLLINSDYSNQKFDLPYIPSNFHYVEGTWSTGFVIEDNNKNQFVWIPCTNKDNLEIPKLEKKYFCRDIDLISKDYCYDIDYKDFIKSALENGGFYISRYEIGKENEMPVSKVNSNIWNNITQKNAIEIANNMYKNCEIKSELINGYAYDTVLSWIMNSNNININNIENDKTYFSGRNEPYNNIYDLFDNILELTNEKNYETGIMRGFYKKDVFQNYSFINENNTRYSLLEDEIEDYVGFRIIIYK